MDDISDLLIGTQMASTLKTIAVHSTIRPDQLDKSRIPVLISSAGTSLRSLELNLGEYDPLGVREGARVTDLHKLTSLQHLCLLHCQACMESTRDYLGVTLQCQVFKSDHAAYAPRADQVGLNAQNYQFSNHTLSIPPFTSLEEVLLEIEAGGLPATGIAKFQQWATTQFPKLAARGILTMR